MPCTTCTTCQLFWADKWYIFLMMICIDWNMLETKRYSKLICELWWYSFVCIIIMCFIPQHINHEEWETGNITKDASLKFWKLYCKELNEKCLEVCTDHQWDTTKGKSTLNIKVNVKLSTFNKHYAIKEHRTVKI